MQLIFWSNFPQKPPDLINPRSSMARQSRSKCRYLGSRPRVNGAWAKARMWRKIENTMILYFAHLLSHTYLREELRVQFVKMPTRCVVGGQQHKKHTGRYSTSLVAIVVLKRRNRESDGLISWRRNVRSKSSVICSKHFKRDEFSRRPGCSGREWDFADSMA